jgi:hypothetical protein
MGKVDTRRMAEGKAETEARTAWLLEVGGRRFRCLREPREGAGRYSLQARSAKGTWIEVTRGMDAVALLTRATRGKTLVELLTRLDAVLPGEVARARA